MRLMSNSVKFSAGRPLLPVYHFSATMATTYSTYAYRLGSVASLNFLAIENTCMPPTFRPMSIIAKRLDISGYRDIEFDGDPAPPPCKGAQQFPTFRPTALARMPAGPHFTHSPYCRLGSPRLAALVAIQPDNCHPSNYSIILYTTV